MKDKWQKEANGCIDQERASIVAAILIAVINARYRGQGGGIDLLERTQTFAVDSVHVFRRIAAGSDRAGWIVGRQFLRSATSVGANAEEAQGAVSRRDFCHRYQIARKELRECRFWLQVMVRTGILQSDAAEPLLREANEIYAILTAIILRSRSDA